MKKSSAPLGLVKGKGTSTSDSIPAMYSKGEVVVPAHVVKAYGEKFFSDLISSVPPNPNAQTTLVNGELNAAGGFLGVRPESDSNIEIDYPSSAQKRLDDTIQQRLGDDEPMLYAAAGYPFTSGGLYSEEERAKRLAMQNAQANGEIKGFSDRLAEMGPYQTARAVLGDKGVENIYAKPVAAGVHVADDFKLGANTLAKDFQQGYQQPTEFGKVGQLGNALGNVFAGKDAQPTPKQQPNPTPITQPASKSVSPIMGKESSVSQHAFDQGMDSRFTNSPQLGTTKPQQTQQTSQAQPVATATQSQQDFNFLPMKNDAGQMVMPDAMPVNTLGVTDGKGGKGQVQFMDGRTLAPQQLGRLQEELQRNADPEFQKRLAANADQTRQRMEDAQRLSVQSRYFLGDPEQQKLAASVMQQDQMLAANKAKSQADLMARNREFDLQEARLGLDREAANKPQVIYNETSNGKTPMLLNKDGTVKKIDMPVQPDYSNYDKATLDKEFQAALAVASPDKIPAIKKKYQEILASLGGMQ